MQLHCVVNTYANLCSILNALTPAINLHVGRQVHTTTKRPRNINLIVKTTHANLIIRLAKVEEAKQNKTSPHPQPHQ